MTQYGVQFGDSFNQELLKYQVKRKPSKLLPKQSKTDFLLSKLSVVDLIKLVKINNMNHSKLPISIVHIWTQKKSRYNPSKFRLVHSAHLFQAELDIKFANVKGSNRKNSNHVALIWIQKVTWTWPEWRKQDIHLLTRIRIFQSTLQEELDEVSFSVFFFFCSINFNWWLWVEINDWYLKICDWLSNYHDLKWKRWFYRISTKLWISTKLVKTNKIFHFWILTYY